MNRQVQKMWLKICFVAVAAGVMAATMVSAQQQEATSQQKPMGAWKECPMEKMQKCMAKCGRTCQTNMENISAAKASLDAASKSLDAGDSAAAKAEVEKAKSILVSLQQSVEQCIQQMPCANKHCPMTGNPIADVNEPQTLCHMYKGMKIGFCSPACPAAWDKLSDAEKDAKLQTVCPMTHKEMMMQKGKEMMQQGQENIKKTKKMIPSEDY